MSGSDLRFVHLSGSEPGQEVSLRRLPATVGSGPDADLLVAGTAPRHAVLFRREADIVLLDSGSPEGTFLAGERVHEAVLRDGDVVELGRGGPRLRFHAPPRARLAPGGHGRRLSDTLVFRMAHHTSRSFRRTIAALAAISALGLAAVFAWGQRQSRLLEAQVSALRREVEQGERDRQGLLARVETQRRRVDEQRGEIEAARREEQALREQLAAAAADEVEALKRELDSAHGRLRTLESERQVAERIIRQYGSGVCMIQGAYTFADAAGRPLRVRVGPDGRPRRAPDGSVELDTEGEGAVHTVEFYGTGFLVDARGLILTNRHLAEPWWSDGEAEAFAAQGYKPRMAALRAFFPRHRGAFELQVERLSEEVDLAVVRADVQGRGVPVLPLARSRGGAVPGQPVVVLGYPAGLEAMLAKAEASLVKQLLAAHGTSSERLTEALATRGLIRPSTTQGHIGDVTKSDIVFDAPTSQGGSGGPVFNKHGEVVAVEYALLSRFGGNSFGVPIAYAHELLKSKTAAR